MTINQTAYSRCAGILVTWPTPPLRRMMFEDTITVDEPTASALRKLSKRWGWEGAMNHELMKGKLEEPLTVKIATGTIHVPAGEEVLILIAWTGGKKFNGSEFIYSTGGSENYLPDSKL